MSRILLLFFVVPFLVDVAYGQYSEEVMEWPEIRLKLSDEITVDDLFEAGLQPFRRPYRENTSIHVKHVRLTIEDRDGTVFPQIAVDVMRISVQKPHLIQRAEIWTPPLTINEARTEMQKWLPMMDKDESELESFLSVVEQDWLSYDTTVGSVKTLGFGDIWNDEDSFQKSVSFLKSWQWQAPVRMSFILSTGRMTSRRRDRSYYDGPIPPPAGFEDVDMTPPEKWEADDRFVPLTTEPRPPQGTLPPEYQAMNKKARAETGVVEQPLTQISGAQNEPGNAIEPKSPTDKTLGLKFWLIVVAAMFGIIALLWLVLKREK